MGDTIMGNDGPLYPALTPSRRWRSGRLRDDNRNSIADRGSVTVPTRCKRGAPMGGQEAVRGQPWQRMVGVRASLALRARDGCVACVTSSVAAQRVRRPEELSTAASFKSA